MERLEVGQPYPHPEMVAQESAGWHLDPSTILEVSPQDSQATRDEWDGARLWLLTHGPLLVLLVKLSDRTLEMPTWLKSDQQMPDWVTTPGARVAFQVINVDQRTGNVVRLRLATASPHFSEVARKEAARTLRPLNDADALAAITAYQARYPFVPDATRAAVVTSLLGVQ